MCQDGGFVSQTPPTKLIAWRTPLRLKRGAFSQVTTYPIMKPKKPLHNKKELQAFRKELRLHLTPAEAFLWKHLKSRQIEGRRFTKQHSIGSYVVDFYCASEQLIIELDGDEHLTLYGQEYDAKRTKFLEDKGYTVIRFENHRVFDFLPSVLLDIRDHFKNK